ncbi:MAG: LuxR C-terminal-related transcriptional regulator [Defluviitaleaceae bacterium]|nr:LuxR C-terminal-related transcriptional regulator [Defluviitaleaceae bacterium]
MAQTLSNQQVPRTALMERIDGFAGKRFIYIHAPAGFGKTVASLLWLEHRESLADITKTQINLDTYDDKTAEFCKRFILALSHLQPGNAALRELAARPVFDSAPIEFVLHAVGILTATNVQHILVLDDLHVIKNEEILNLLPVLLKRLNERFIVLLLSRTEPPDSFSEMIAKDEMAIIDAEYLQFSGDEIKSLFEKNKKRITNRQAEEILDSTGGWAIGIRSLLLSDDEAYPTKLTGRYLENFLKTHVWEKWDAKVKDFMMLVSVVEELTPGLCDKLISGDKSLKNVSGAQMLSDLIRENAFLRAVGDDVYKFHDLFRDFLLNILEQKGRLLIQYNKAGKYFYDNKDYFRAVQYYLRAKNDDGAALSIYHMYDHNSPYAAVEETLKTVRLTLNDRIIDKHPFLIEVQAWSAFVEGHADEFEYHLDKYYRLLPKIILQTPRSFITSMLLRCTDYRVEFKKVVKMLRLVPFKGIVKAFTPSITQGIPYFHRSCRDFSDISNDMEGIIALADKSIGIVIGEEYPVIKECIFAGICYEKGMITEAREHAMAAYGNIRQNHSPEIRLCAMSILTAALFADGQTEASEKMFGNIEQMIIREGAFHLNMNLRALQYFTKLINGDKTAAKEWLSLYGKDTQDYLPLYKIPQHYTTARAFIVSGDNDAAILFLMKILRFAERYHRPLDIIETNILLAVAYRQKGRSSLGIASEHLEKAVTVAYRYKYTQQFTVEGSELTAMLHKMQKRAQQGFYSERIPADFIKILYINAVTGSKRTKGLTGGRTPENLSFTSKQREVMRLMCEGNNRNEIGAKMGIKPYGIKSHISLIYGKLNVVNSIEAVMKIKELGILTDERNEGRKQT